LLEVVGSRLAGPAVAAIVKVVDALPPPAPLPDDPEAVHALSVAREETAIAVRAMARTCRRRGCGALERMTVPFFS
jgi:hypothetical protein